MAAAGSWLPLAAGVLVALVIHCCLYGPQAAFIAEQFSPRLRYTGSSLAYTLAGIIGGAIAPLLFTTLLSAYGSWVPLALYIALASAVSLVGVLLGRGPDAAVDEDVRLAAPKSRAAADVPLSR
jgi:MFS family permease